MKNLLFLTALLAIALGVKAQGNFQRTPQGLQYRIVTANPGERIKLNDVITFNVVQKTEKDSVIFSSYVVGRPIKLQVQPTQNVGDLMTLFPLLTNKDSVIARVPADSVFRDHEESRPQYLPKGSTVVFVVKVEKVQSLNDAIAERNADMEKLRTNETVAAAKYIAANGLNVKTTASGLKYMITRASAKRKVSTGDTVLVNYVGKTLAGKVFDTNIAAEAAKAGIDRGSYEPFEVVIGEGRVIPGWEEVLQLLNEGSKVTAIIPSTLAYGPQGAGADIAPFSTLAFDMEVVKVKPAKRAATTTVKKTVTKTTAKKPAAKTAAKKPKK